MQTRDDLWRRRRHGVGFRVSVQSARCVGRGRRTRATRENGTFFWRGKRWVSINEEGCGDRKKKEEIVPQGCVVDVWKGQKCTPPQLQRPRGVACRRRRTASLTALISRRWPADARAEMTLPRSAPRRARDPGEMRRRELRPAWRAVAPVAAACRYGYRGKGGGRGFGCEQVVRSKKHLWIRRAQA